jgi:hypothetical protein
VLYINGNHSYKKVNVNTISVCRFDFKGIIDYIFYSKQSMTPLGLLGPLAPEWLRENKVVGCPHPHVPSGKSAHSSAFAFFHSNKIDVACRHNHYVSGHYPSSCFYLKLQRFGDWILSSSSGKTYSVGPS